MPNTTNFNFPTPADTDLVKDGAAAIRSLGNSIDTAFVDLKGGTTGQILAKNSNTDLDFTWTNGGDVTEVQAGTGISVASGTGPIPVVTNTVATTFDAKGDLVVGTGADTFAKLTSSGVNNQVLTVDTSTATGLKWASATQSKNFTLVNAGGTTLSGSSSVTISGISNADQIFILINGATGAALNSMSIRLNGDTGNNYNFFGMNVNPATTYARTIFSTQNVANSDGIVFGTNGAATAGVLRGAINIFGCNSSGNKMIQIQTGMTQSSDNNQFVNGGGYYTGSSTISSVNFYSGSNFTGGTVFVFTSS